MFPDLTEPHIEVNPLQFVVKQNEQFLNIDQLSDGYKTLLGLVIDLSARMAMVNPNSPNPLAEQAIVMIDESLSVRFPAIVSLKQEDTQATLFKMRKPHRFWMHKSGYWTTNSLPTGTTLTPFMMSYKTKPPCA